MVRRIPSNVFRDCPVSIEVWNKLGVRCYSVSFMDWIEKMLGDPTEELKEKILYACWDI